MAFVIDVIKWLLWTLETMYFDVVEPVFKPQPKFWRMPIVVTRRVRQSVCPSLLALHV